MGLVEGKVAVLWEADFLWSNLVWFQTPGLVRHFVSNYLMALRFKEQALAMLPLQATMLALVSQAQEVALTL